MLLSSCIKHSLGQGEPPKRHQGDLSLQKHSRPLPFCPHLCVFACAASPPSNVSLSLLQSQHVPWSGRLSHCTMTSRPLRSFLSLSPCLNSYLCLENCELVPKLERISCPLLIRLLVFCWEENGELCSVGALDGGVVEKRV